MYLYAHYIWGDKMCEWVYYGNIIINKNTHIYGCLPALKTKLYIKR